MFVVLVLKFDKHFCPKKSGSTTEKGNPTCLPSWLSVPVSCPFLYWERHLWGHTVNWIRKLACLKARGTFPAGLVSGWISPLSQFAVESHEHPWRTKVGAGRSRRLGEEAGCGVDRSASLVSSTCVCSPKVSPQLQTSSRAWDFICRGIHS